MTTKIEWADMTINPVVGCTKCSDGCRSCYAERFAARLAKNPATAQKYAVVIDEHGKWTGNFNVDLTPFASLPKKSKRIFIGSMCDIFHENASYNWFLWIVHRISQYPQHTFILLTKRPQRMNNFISLTRETDTDCGLWPLPNLWLGVTVCNQAEADEKIPALLQTPAAVRFVSVEPCLGPVDLQAAYPHDWMHCKCCGWYGPDDGESGADHIINEDGSEPICPQCGNDGEAGEFDWTREVAAAYKETILPGLDWVICGGETGPGARPMHPDWVRGLRDQCQAAGVPFFFKGWGELVTENQSPEDIVLPGHSTIPHGWKGRKYEDSVYRVGKRRAGRLLDGVEHNEFPEMQA